jgi:transcription elongation GreA/GreB family factor
MQLHKLKPNESRDSDGKPVYLTPEGIEKLQNELARLKARVPDAAGETARTAAYGDRSDNAEYKQAKGALRRMHYRIFEIETQLKHAVAIKVDPSSAGIIQLGSTVVLASEGAAPSEAHRQKKFQIVGPDETDPARGRISYLSPLGSVLLKHKKGDLVEIKTATGTQSYRVIEVR